MLGALLVAGSFIGVCCNSKAATITMTILATLAVGASVGCYVRYKENTLDSTLNTGLPGLPDSYDFAPGFMVACATVGMALLTSISACCMRSKNDDYFQLA